ncbi:serine protease, S1-C subfamily, contains C-terminal PDZ domain [Chitinophaga niabensis]|uniref:Serine protease, S1-C subfamily, contains C-terminal PDZ domain n=2 Tax=Chitinophaga niabensis TaxID=536979 RepID=A0A1N6GFF0_9BACT|nr:serine protease, S1-C subfamily, contains C-terminal PDZ domain [Chitinophaga niabensis]
MNDIHLIQEIERYLDGEMSTPEREAFDVLRRSDSNIDRQVTEHQLLLQQFRANGQRKALLRKMEAIHAQMPAIPVAQPATPVVKMRSKRTWLNLAAAACIALLTSLGTIAVMQKAAKNSSTAQYEDVRRVLNNIQRSQNALNRDINIIKKAPLNPGTYGGTCFAISRNGYMVTNYHVIAGADSIYIQNNKGEAFKAVSVFEDVSSDLAVLRIADSGFRSPSLPYSLKQQPIRPGEEVFTMGFPRDEIVYGKGYISAQTGFNGDTLAYQVSIQVNPGNSGAPLLDNNGEVIGIITGKQSTSDGIAFAVKSGHLKRLLDELPKERFSRKDLKGNQLNGLNRVEQLKKLEEFVYMVKVYN